ncbi:MAG: PilZ domain-containing protein [Desulfobacterales bacterium]|nr:PilZ domain-containing protein [Desulfobacterales bacterium]
MTSNSNQRKYIRIQPSSEYPIPIHINGTNFFDILVAVDISVGGVGIIVPHLFDGCQINELVTLVITIPYPTKKSFIVKGIIRHVKGTRFGVQFVNLEAKHKSYIRKYISFHLNQISIWKKVKFLLHLI